MKSDVPPTIDAARRECHAGITATDLHGLTIVALRDTFARGLLFNQRLQKELAAKEGPMPVIGSSDFRPDLVHRKPMVVVAIGGREISFPAGPIGKTSDLRGNREILALWTTSSAIQVIAGNENEADRIACEVSRQLIVLLPSLVAGIGALRAEVKGIRAPTDIERDVFKSASAVDVVWQWGEVYTIREIGRETAEISITIAAENLNGVSQRAM